MENPEITCDGRPTILKADDEITFDSSRSLLFINRPPATRLRLIGDKVRHMEINLTDFVQIVQLIAACSSLSYETVTATDKPHFTTFKIIPRAGQPESKNPVGDEGDA